VLEAISGIVTLGMLVLSVGVGVRLVRLGRRDGAGPVVWLGLYFLIYSGLATGLSVTTYIGWSGVGVALPEAVTRLLNGAFFVSSTLGVSCLLVFTQRTFRPDSGRARAFVACDVLAMALGTLALGLSEGFQVRVVNGPAYWVVFLGRLAAWAWVAGEAIVYWIKQRRRLALGLADPIVANRFLLWGVWGVVVTVLAFADPLARLWYWAATGTSTVWVPAVGRPIIQVTVPLACGLSFASAVLMVLIFFPSAGYKRWILARHALEAR